MVLARNFEKVHTIFSSSQPASGVNQCDQIFDAYWHPCDGKKRQSGHTVVGTMQDAKKREVEGLSAASGGDSKKKKFQRDEGRRRRIRGEAKLSGQLVTPSPLFLQISPSFFLAPSFTVG